MKTRFFALIGALILSAVTIILLTLCMPHIRNGVLPMNVLFGLGTCLYTGWIFSLPLEGYRQRRWKSVLLSPKTWLISLICIFLLSAGIFFATAEVSSFPADQANQRVIGYGIIIGWTMGIFATVGSWYYIGYSDVGMFIFIARSLNWTITQINDELRRRQRLGWFPPGDIFLKEDDDAEKAPALPDRQK